MSETAMNFTKTGIAWSAARFWGALLLVFLASIPMRLAGPTPDVSWLITMCERILHGETAYVDIFETTPPVPMLLYMPGVAFSRLTGLSAEAATFAFAYIAAFASLALSARILPNNVSEGGSSRWLVLFPSALVLLVLANDAFAQREYFAAAFALPMISVFIRHGQGGVWPSLTERALAAALAGLTIAIKPPLFAFPGVVVAAYYWWRTGSLSFLLSSGIVAAAVIGLAVTAASLAAFPEYLGEISTLVREVYVPVRSDLLSFLNDKACLGVLSCIGIALVLSAGKRPPVVATLALLTASGFLAVYFIQGKYFPYHVLPAALFAAIAAWIPIHQRLRSLRVGPRIALARAAGVYGLAVLGVSALFFRGFNDGRPIMTNLAWASGLDRPTALAISPDIATAFPLARDIDAIWVNRIHSQWVARYTRYALQAGGLTEAEASKFERYHRQDLNWIMSQIGKMKPDIIIQDISPGHSWLLPELNALEPNFLHEYDVLAEEGAIRVLRRASGVGRKRPDRHSGVADEGALSKPPR